ncbi:MAG TPA: L,D-transpeptidase family protein [Candidatus Dormibacteraeota bacterium]|nr:L,D-transpeptidase family protein [Candidatus Dormibacteraeota bacterium]
MTALIRRHPISLKIAIPVALAVLLAGAGGLLAFGNSSALQAAGRYHRERQVLNAELNAASQQGYTTQDLRPITSRLAAMDGSQKPWFSLGQARYYDQMAQEASSLQRQLGSLERRLFTQAQQDAGKQVATAKTAITQAQQVGADDPDLQALQQKLAAAEQTQSTARTLGDYRNAADQARQVASAASALATRTQQENQQIDQAAQQLISQTGGSLSTIQQDGLLALANGRNDASVAAYENKPRPFKTYDDVMRAYSRLEKFAANVRSSSLDQAAVAAAGLQRYANQIHQDLIDGMPSQFVIVSFQAQHVWAYQGGQVVMDSPVTTGVRGVSDIGTDFGPMKVLRKSHPWTMHSPWPKGSPYWYPDTVVQWTVFFTNTGEAFHDAYWEPDSALGPGSQYNPAFRSHGCIHLPLAKAQWMYQWAPIGMPVVVYPGDGSPVANQLAQITTNSQGVPLGTP